MLDETKRRVVLLLGDFTRARIARKKQKRAARMPEYIRKYEVKRINDPRWVLDYS
jgi:hypothetical protein